MTVRRRTGDIVFAAFMLAVSGLIETKARAFPTISSDAMGGGLGPGFYPRLVAVVFAGLAIFMMISAVWDVRKRHSVVDKSRLVEPVPGYYRRYVVPVIMLVLLATYGLAMSLVGFGVSTFAFLAICITVLGRHEWKKRRTMVVGFLVIALLATIGIYGVFRYVAKVSLPTGTLSVGR